MDHNVYVHFDGVLDVNRKLDKLLTRTARILALEEQELQEIDDLEAQVAATKAGEDSAIVLLNGIVAQIQALEAQIINPADKAKLTTMRTTLQDSTAALAAAVAAVPPAP